MPGFFRAFAQRSGFPDERFDQWRSPCTAGLASNEGRRLSSLCKMRELRPHPEACLVLPPITASLARRRPRHGRLRQSYRCSRLRCCASLAAAPMGPPDGNARRSCLLLDRLECQPPCSKGCRSRHFGRQRRPGGPRGSRGGADGADRHVLLDGITGRSADDLGLERGQCAKGLYDRSGLSTKT